jgi:hypothetical protein
LSLIAANQRIAKFSFLAFFLTACKLVFGSVVEDSLKQVSMHDRACMSTFFDDAIKKDQIVHILYFENKPVSVIDKILMARGALFQ